jgi:cyclophilin family peptidyl-prolyl cis-trans isomerase
MKLVRTFWVVLFVAAAIVIAGCGSSTPPEGTGTAEEAVPPEAPPAAEEAPPEGAPAEPPQSEGSGASIAPAAPEAPPKAAAPPKTAPKKAATGKPVVVMDTSKGTIRIELDEEKAPVTVKNFLAYVDAKFYDGTIFHRVMPGFMIQGGGFGAAMQEKDTRAPIKNESSNGLSNTRGTLAMARTSDPNSATAQFFINHGEKNMFLDKANAGDGWGYAVFGKVIEGMDVVDAIALVPTTTKGPHEKVPTDAVVIKSIRRAS